MSITETPTDIDYSNQHNTDWEELISRGASSKKSKFRDVVDDAISKTFGFTTLDDNTPKLGTRLFGTFPYPIPPRSVKIWGGDISGWSDPFDKRSKWNGLFRIEGSNQVTFNPVETNIAWDLLKIEGSDPVSILFDDYVTESSSSEELEEDDDDSSWETFDGDDTSSNDGENDSGDTGDHSEEFSENYVSNGGDLSDHDEDIVSIEDNSPILITDDESGDKIESTSELSDFDECGIDPFEMDGLESDLMIPLDQLAIQRETNHCYASLWHYMNLIDLPTDHFNVLRTKYGIDTDEMRHGDILIDESSDELFFLYQSPLGLALYKGSIEEPVIPSYLSYLHVHGHYTNTLVSLVYPDVDTHRIFPGSSDEYTEWIRGLQKMITKNGINMHKKGCYEARHEVLDGGLKEYQKYISSCTQKPLYDLLYDIQYRRIQIFSRCALIWIYSDVIPMDVIRVIAEYVM